MKKLRISQGVIYHNEDTGYFCFIPWEEYEEYPFKPTSNIITDHEILIVYPTGKTFIKEDLKKRKRELIEEADNEIDAQKYFDDTNLFEFKMEMCEIRREILRKERDWAAKGTFHLPGH